MTVVVLLSQPLRQKEAGQFLAHRDGERKLAVTRFEANLDNALFPVDTEFVSWSSVPNPPPSRRAMGRIDRVKRWLRGGSTLGHRVDRWVLSAEWRLRYVDRLLALVESRKGSHWDLENPELVEVLDRHIGGGQECEVAVFDIFDLPAALRYSRRTCCRVVVR